MRDICNAGEWWEGLRKGLFCVVRLGTGQLFLRKKDVAVTVSTGAKKPNAIRGLVNV
jgi:hypothetical protein